jgi:hypothetical protein
MPKYLIERDIPNAGRSRPTWIIAQRSCVVLGEMGPGQWVQAMTEDRSRVSTRDNADLIRDHAKFGGFPPIAFSKWRRSLIRRTRRRCTERLTAHRRRCGKGRYRLLPPLYRLKNLADAPESLIVRTDRRVRPL